MWKKCKVRKAAPDIDGRHIATRVPAPLAVVQSDPFADVFARLNAIPFHRRKAATG